MKIASFIYDREQHVGIVEADHVIDAGLRPDRLAPEDPLCSLQFETSGPKLPLDSVKLVSPIPWPSKVIGVGLNYREHVQEGQGAQVPETPMIFAIFPNAVIGHRSPIRLPAISDSIDYEAELAVVIGKTTTKVSSARALDHVFGYTCANDVSARVAQRSGNWVFGKSSDTFLPLGPWVVTADELPDPQQLAFRCFVNGELRQSGSTSDMVFSVAHLIAFISQAVTLVPGDVIVTGTTAGVGVSRQPPTFLRAGDRVRVEVDGIGALENSVVGA